RFAVKARSAARFDRLQTTRTGGLRACIRRVVGCATSTGSAGHAGATASSHLTVHLGHSMKADKIHLKWLSKRRCLVWGRQPSDPHHLRFAQQQAFGRKVRTEFNDIDAFSPRQGVVANAPVSSRSGKGQIPRASPPGTEECAERAANKIVKHWKTGKLSA